MSKSPLAQLGYPRLGRRRRQRRMPAPAEAAPAPIRTSIGQLRGSPGPKRPAPPLGSAAAAVAVGPATTLPTAVGVAADVGLAVAVAVGGGPGGRAGGGDVKDGGVPSRSRPVSGIAGVGGRSPRPGGREGGAP